MGEAVSSAKEIAVKATSRSFQPRHTKLAVASLYGHRPTSTAGTLSSDGNVRVSSLLLPNCGNRPQEIADGDDRNGVRSQRHG